MLKLVQCEFWKLKRKPLIFISLLLSAFMPLAYAFFLADVNTDVDAVNGMMSSLFQLSAYLLLMPLLVILALSAFMPLAYAFFLADVNTDVDAVNGMMSSLFQLSAYLLLMPLLVILASNLLFEELDNDTLKNLAAIPVNRTKLVLSKMLVLLLFAIVPLLVILASNLLFEELDNDTLKNLAAIPVNRTKLVLSKMLVLLLFAIDFMAIGGLISLVVLLFQGWKPVGFWILFGVGLGEGMIMWVGALPCILLFMAIGGLISLVVLLFQGWKPVGFWILFGVGLGEGMIMWVGALPCILLVILLNKNYIVSVVITFFYTIVNYILSMNDMFLTQPFGLNIGTLFPGPLAFRWTFQFYDQSQTSAELAGLLDRISPYFLNCNQVFGVIIVEAIVFLALIAVAYRRQEI